MPQIYFSTQIASPVLKEDVGDGSTVAELIVEIIRRGERRISGHGNAFFTDKDDVWVDIKVENGVITLELGEPGA